MPEKVDFDIILRDRKAQQTLKGVADKGKQLFEDKGFLLNIKQANFPLGKITGDFDKFGESLDAAASRVLAFTATTTAVYGLALAFSRLITDSIKLEKQMAGIQSILQTSSSNLQKVSEELFTIANATGQAFDTAAEAASEFARQGLSLEDTLSATTSALTFAKIAGIDASQAVENLTASLNTFNSEALDYTSVVDTIVSLDNSFAISAAGISDGLKRVGSVASESGLELKQVASLISVVQQVSARGAPVISNGLKTIFTRLGRSGVQDALAGIGVATKNSNGEFRSQIDILTDLARTMDSLSDSQRAFISEQVGGVYQINTLQSTLKALRGEYSLYDKAVKIAGDSSGNAAERLKILTDTSDVQLQKLKNNLTQFLAEAGKVTLKPLADSFISYGNFTLGGLKSLLGVGDGLEAEAGKSGSLIGKALIGGIQSVLSGPGVVLAVLTIGKLLKKLLVDVAKASAVLSGLKRASITDSSAQLAVNEAITKGNRDLVQRLGIVSNINEKTAILNALLTESAVRQRGLQINSLIAAGLTNAGRKGSQPRSANSSGFVPNFSPGEMMEKAGAKEHGYRAGRVYQTRIHDGSGKSEVSYVNSAEKVVNFINSGGKRATMVVPPNGFGENTTYASDGFIPNFNQKRKSRPFPFGSPSKAFIDATITGDNAQVHMISSFGEGKGQASKLYEGFFKRSREKGLKSIDGNIIPQFRKPRDNTNISKVLAMYPQLSRGRFAKRSSLDFHNGEVLEFGGEKDFYKDLSEQADYILHYAERTPSAYFKSYLSKGFVPNFVSKSSLIGSGVSGSFHRLNDEIGVKRFYKPKKARMEDLPEPLREKKFLDAINIQGKIRLNQKIQDEFFTSKILSEVTPLVQGITGPKTPDNLKRALRARSIRKEIIKDPLASKSIGTPSGYVFGGIMQEALKSKGLLMKDLNPNNYTLNSQAVRFITSSNYLKKPRGERTKETDEEFFKRFATSGGLATVIDGGSSEITSSDLREKTFRSLRESNKAKSSGFVPNFASLNIRDFAGGIIKNPKATEILSKNAKGNVEFDDKISSVGFKVEKIPIPDENLYKSIYSNTQSQDVKDRFEQLALQTLHSKYGFSPNNDLEGGSNAAVDGYSIDNVAKKQISLLEVKGGDFRINDVSNKFGRFLPENIAKLGERSQALFTEGVPNQFDIIKSRNILAVPDVEGSKKGFKGGAKRKTTGEELFYGNPNLSEVEDSRLALSISRNRRKVINSAAQSGKKLASNNFQRAFFQESDQSFATVDDKGKTTAPKRLEKESSENLEKLYNQLGISVNKSEGFVPNFASSPSAVKFQLPIDVAIKAFADQLRERKRVRNLTLENGSSLRYKTLGEEKGRDLSLSNIESTEKGSGYRLFSQLTELSARKGVGIESDVIVPQPNGLIKAIKRGKEGTIQQLLREVYPQIRYREIPGLETRGSIFSNGSDQSFDSLAGLDKIVSGIDPSLFFENEVRIKDLYSKYSGDIKDIKGRNADLRSQGGGKVQTSFFSEEEERTLFKNPPYPIRIKRARDGKFKAEGIEYVLNRIIKGEKFVPVSANIDDYDSLLASQKSGGFVPNFAKVKKAFEVKNLNKYIGGLRGKSKFRNKEYSIRDLIKSIETGEGYSVIKGDNFSPLKGRFSQGFIPNFSNALDEAKNREMQAGYSKKQVRVARSMSLVTPLNPQGFGVYNSDEGSLSMGMSLAKRAGIDPRSKGVEMSYQGFIPNFAGKREGKRPRISARQAIKEQLEEIEEDTFNATIRPETSITVLKGPSQSPKSVLSNPVIKDNLPPFVAPSKPLQAKNSFPNEPGDPYSKSIKEIDSLTSAIKALEKSFKEEKNSKKKKEIGQALKRTRGNLSNKIESFENLKETDILRIRESDRNRFLSSNNGQKSISAIGQEEEEKQSKFNRFFKGKQDEASLLKKDRLQSRVLTASFAIPALLGAITGPDEQKTKTGQIVSSVGESFGAGVSTAAALGFTPVGIAAGVLITAFSLLDGVTRATALSTGELQKSTDALITRNEEQIQSASLSSSKKLEVQSLKDSGALPEKIAKVEAEYLKSLGKIKDFDLANIVQNEKDSNKISEAVSNFQEKKAKEVELSKASLTLNTLSSEADKQGIDKNLLGGNFGRRKVGDFDSNNFAIVFDPIADSFDSLALSSEVGKRAIEKLNSGSIDLGTFLKEFGTQLGLTEQQVSETSTQFNNLNKRFSKSSISNLQKYAASALELNNVTNQRAKTKDLEKLSIDTTIIFGSAIERILRDSNFSNFKKTSKESSLLNIEEQRLQFSKNTGDTSDRDFIKQKAILENRKKNVQAEDGLNQVLKGAVSELLALPELKGVQDSEKARISSVSQEVLKENGKNDFTDLVDTIRESLKDNFNKTVFSNIESISSKAVDELKKIKSSSDISREEAKAGTNLQLVELRKIALKEFGQKVLSGEQQKARQELLSQDVSAIPRLEKEIKDLEKQKRFVETKKGKEKIDAKISDKQLEIQRRKQKISTLELSAQGFTNTKTDEGKVTQEAQRSFLAEQADKIIQGIGKRRVELGTNSNDLFSQRERKALSEKIKEGDSKGAKLIIENKLGNSDRAGVISSSDSILLDLIDQLKNLGGKEDGFFTENFRKTEDAPSLEEFSSDVFTKMKRVAGEALARKPSDDIDVLTGVSKLKSNPIIKDFESAKFELNNIQAEKLRLAEESKSVTTLPPFPQSLDTTLGPKASTLREIKDKYLAGNLSRDELKRYTEGDLSLQFGVKMGPEKDGKREVIEDIKSDIQKAFSNINLPTSTQNDRRDAISEIAEQEKSALVKVERLGKRANPIIKRQEFLARSPSSIDTSFLLNNERSTHAANAQRRTSAEIGQLFNKVSYNTRDMEGFEGLKEIKSLLKTIGSPEILNEEIPFLFEELKRKTEDFQSAFSQSPEIKPLEASGPLFDRGRKVVDDAALEDSKGISEASSRLQATKDPNLNPLIASLERLMLLRERLFTGQEKSSIVGPQIEDTLRTIQSNILKNAASIKGVKDPFSEDSPEEKDGKVSIFSGLEKSNETLEDSVKKLTKALDKQTEEQKASKKDLPPPKSKSTTSNSQSSKIEISVSGDKTDSASLKAQVIAIVEEFIRNSEVSSGSISSKNPPRNLNTATV